MADSRSAAVHGRQLKNPFDTVMGSHVVDKEEIAPSNSGCWTLVRSIHNWHISSSIFRADEFIANNWEANVGINLNRAPAGRYPKSMRQVLNTSKFLLISSLL